MFIVYYINLSSSIICLFSGDIYCSFAISIDFSFVFEKVPRVLPEAGLVI